jgi:TPR repeat protein
MYRQGWGVAQNDAEAVQWFRKAADQGDTTAQTSLGVMYRQGWGVAQNDAEAVQWFQKAADQGEAQAQFNLGVMYREGWGVAQNVAEAAKWFRKAADQGDTTAQANLGFMYEVGWGVAQNDAEAAKWYQEATDKWKDLGIKDLGIDERLRLRLEASLNFVRSITPWEPSPPTVSPTPAAQPRRALVIGNAAYPDSPLTNPINDATDLAALLRRLGFDVTLHQNADRPTLEKAVDVFTRGVPRGSAGLFFYAGHGVQIDGGNYLVPIGANLHAGSDIKYHAVAADWVLARMDESGMDVKLLLLDACRDNPLGRSFTRALTRGLAVMQTPQGALIAYATSPGKTALDGTGRNSPFTAQLLQELGKPGRDIEVVLKAVRAGVQQSTKGEQIPWVASSMTGDFYVAR